MRKTERVYRFAEFELKLAEGELRTGSSVVPLQEKPLLLLAALLDHPQQLVAREELRRRMWDTRTVVDYEQGINVAMRKLREALGDSADSPRFIATVAKKGYRFLVPVEIVSDEAPVQSVTGPPVAMLPATSAGRSRIWAVAAVVCCVIGAGIFALKSGRGAARPIHSIAVLPLQSLSPDAGQDYFADGITEELITNLAQRLKLRVISRTSVMPYKGTNKPIGQIARELGVEAIVEGSVARVGDRVTLTVQLIDATEDRHLWAGKYERRIEDILAVEAELSQAVAAQVSGTLNVAQSRLAASRVPAPRVYDLCLLGRYHWGKRTREGLIKAEEYFREAIELDPSYAPAYAGLANTYAMRPHYDAVSMADYSAKATATARQALALDDTLAEAHTTLGFIALGGADSAGAESEFRRALELNPSYAFAHHWFAYFLLFADRPDEALAEVELARQLDPLSAVINADQGEFLYTARHFDEARESLRRSIELRPEFGQPHATLALIELETGHLAKAMEEARAGFALDPHNPRTLAEAGYVFAVSGQTAEAQTLLATVQDLEEQGAALPVFPALIEVGLGQRDQARATLKQMFVTDPTSGLKGVVQWHAFDGLVELRSGQIILAKESKTL